MNYDSVKKYGEFVRKTAHHISTFDDIYKAAAALPYDMRSYLVMSYVAFFELNLNIDNNEEVISKLIIKYILSPEIDKYIVNNQALDQSMEFDFIEHDCGDFFGIMKNIQIDIAALTYVSNRNEYDEKDVAWAKKQIANRIELTPETYSAMSYSLRTLFQKEQPQVHSDVQPDEQLEKTQSKYTIENETLLLDILNYLRSTGVLEKDYPYHVLAEAVVNADISKIQPILQDKFRSSLSHIQKCVKTQKKEWLRDVCASINIVPKEASKNNTNLGEWYEMLRDRVKKQLKK